MIGRSTQRKDSDQPSSWYQSIALAKRSLGWRKLGVSITASQRCRDARSMVLDYCKRFHKYTRPLGALQCFPLRSSFFLSLISIPHRDLDFSSWASAARCPKGPTPRIWEMDLLWLIWGLVEARWMWVADSITRALFSMTGL